MAALQNWVGGEHVGSIDAAMPSYSAAQVRLSDEAAFGLIGSNGYFNHHAQASASAFGSNT